MVVVAFLKFLFRVPLMAHLGEGWAFPSGHMFVATTFWLFLAIQLRNSLFSTLVLIILSGIAGGLIYQKYHVFFDVFAAVIFSFILIVLYNLLLKFKFIHSNDGLLACMMLGFCCLLLFSLPKFPHHMKIPLGALTGLLISSFCKELPFFNKSINNFLEFVLCIVGVILVYYLSSNFNFFPNLPLSLMHLILGLWVVCGAKILITFLKFK